MKQFWATICLMLVVFSWVAIPHQAQDSTSEFITDDSDTVRVFHGVSEQSMSLPFSGSEYYCRLTRFGFCRDVVDLTTTSLMGIDHTLGWYVPNVHNGLAENWEFSDANRVLTITLRDDLEWSDGLPITAADVMMSVELRLTPEANPNGMADVDRFNAIFSQVEAIDDHTLQIIFAQPRCGIISEFNLWLLVLPAHIYRQLIDDVGYAGLAEHPWMQAPTVVSGAYRIEHIAPDRTVYLKRNENFSDNPSGTMPIEHYVAVQTETDSNQIADIVNGDYDLVTQINPGDVNGAREAASNGDIKLFIRRDNGFTYIAFNTADPTNPQPALDENGQRIDQGLHPIFGDKLVRQALTYATDVQQIIDEVRLGNSQRMSSNLIADSWAHDPSLEPIPYDPQHALELLNEAGWRVRDASAPPSLDNPMICVDCLYAREVDPDYVNTPFHFEMYPGLSGIIALGTLELIQQQWAQIGVSFDILEANTADTVNAAMSQTFDALYLGWNLAYPIDPATHELFGVAHDLTGSRFNFTSFYNEAYFALEETALTIPGCGITERAAIYHQMQRILRDEAPYIFLENPIHLVAASPRIQGIDVRGIAEVTWNVDTWRIADDE